MDPFDLSLWPGFQAAGGDLTKPAIIDQVAIDSRRIDSPNAIFVALMGQHQDGHRFIEQAHENGAKYVLIKKEWTPCKSLANLIYLRVDNPLIALQEIAESYRKQLTCRMIAVTGSYGKTMVKDLLQAMLNTSFSVASSPESFNSQIGVPLSLLTIKKTHDIAIIEAAISQKDEMNLLERMIQPENCIITHIGKKHLATLGSMDVTAKEMLKLQPKGWMILPNDPHIVKNLELSENQYFWNEATPLLPHGYYNQKKNDTMMPYQINFPDGTSYHGTVSSGFYFFLDLLNITIKAAWLLNVPAKNIALSLEKYTPVPMRTEIWKSPIGTTFINDTYCSDPQSIDTSLKYLSDSPSHSRKIFAFGGMRGERQHLENEYKRIGQAIHKSQVDLLILFGNHKFNSLIKEMKKISPKTEVFQCTSYQDAIKFMQTSLEHNDIVLIKGDEKRPFDLITEAFNDSICSNQCVINLAAIAENVSTIRSRLIKNTRIMVMVKALAYGTDDVRIARFLQSTGVDILGVSYVDEGVTLKRAGISQSIFVISSAIYEAAKVVKWGLEIGVSERNLIEAVSKEASIQNKKIKVHLHVDTGMGRFGCRPEEALSLAKLISNHPHLEFEGLMTHFASADDPSQDEFTNQQAHRLIKISNELKENNLNPTWVHAANSSAAIRFHFPQFNMVRIGLAVYGLYASSSTKNALELRLALSLNSRIVGINTCKLGETISYGRNYKVLQQEQKIAVLPIGYFDGLHRNYSGKSSVIIRGKKAPMVGNICMDFMMVDVSEIPYASQGDPVLIFGEDEYGHYISPEELATKGDSIIHELITCLGPRIQRIFVHEESMESRLNHY